MKNEVLSPPEFKEYAVAMLRLQEEAGLTYREARVLLSNYRENFLLLADEWGITKNAIYNLERRGLKKLEAAGCKVEDFVSQAMSMFCIDPLPVGTENESA